MDEKNKKLLTRTEERISFLYIEKARIEQTEYGIQIISGNQKIEVPITTINCLILGPGTSITQKAICNIASASCTVCVTGTDLSVFYTYGQPATNKSKNLLMQIKYHENVKLHLDIVHKMYSIRYPDEKLKSKTVEQLRGIEGRHVKEAYENAASQNEIEWNGRNYAVDNFEGQDTVNQYLTALNHALYAIVTAAIVSTGFSPAIGFIHTGHVSSFVFDIADLYKEKYMIPLAFKLAQHSYDRHKMLAEFRKLITEEKLMSQIVNDLFSLFSTEEDAKSIEVDLRLWGDKNFGIFGKNYSSTS